MTESPETAPLRRRLGSARTLHALRRHAHDGRRILPHRSIARLPLPPRRLGVGVAIATGATALLLGLAPALADAWGALLLGWLRAIGLAEGFVDAAALQPPTWPALPVPRVQRFPGAGGQVGLVPQALATFVVWVAAGRLPDALRPMGYLARLAALIHGASLVVLALWPARFAHSVGGHVADQLGQAWLLMLVVPWLHLLVFHLLPLRWWRRVALSALTLAWLALAAPHLALLHVVVLEWLGLAAMPLLYMLGGAVPLVLGIVALYGWAMSWQPPRPAHVAAGVAPDSAMGPTSQAG